MDKLCLNISWQVPYSMSCFWILLSYHTSLLYIAIGIAIQQLPLYKCQLYSNEAIHQRKVLMITTIPLDDNKESCTCL